MSDYYKTYVSKNTNQPADPPTPEPTQVQPTNPNPPQPAVPPTPVVQPPPVTQTPITTPPNPEIPAQQVSPSKAPVYLTKKGKFPISVKKVLNPWVLASLLIIVGTGVGAYFILNSNLKIPSLNSVLGAKTVDEETRILNEVGELMILPQNEKPTVANITNVEQLKIRQKFFEPAQDGDKLIVYSNKVIIYRPADHKIVDVSQVNVNTNPTDTPDLPSTTPLTP